MFCDAILKLLFCIALGFLLGFETKGIDVRLISNYGNVLPDGSNEGTVQIYYKDKWHYICKSSYWGTEAIVVCRMLGFEYGGTALRYSSYNYNRYSSIPVISRVHCLSTEEDIGNCSFQEGGTCGLYGYGYGYGYDRRLSAVRCNRPVDGHWNRWSSWTPCPVTCGAGLRYRYRYCNNPTPMYGGANCTGESKEEMLCQASQKCPEPYDIRIGRRYYGYSSGTVEVYRKYDNSESGEWGTICDDSFGKAEADVICKMAGYKFGGMPRIRSHYGPGSGPIWIDELQCNGTDERLDECTHNEWGESNCDHTEDAGVECVTGNWGGWTYCSASCGTGTRARGFVCDNHQNCAIVSEKENCSSAPCAVDGVWTNWGEWSVCSVTCENGTKHRQRECSNPAPKYGGKQCSGDAVEILPCDMGINCPVEVRLSGGVLDNQGRVEVYYNRSWGTICDDKWDNRDAEVVCRMLNYSAGGVILNRANFDSGSGIIWLDNVDCDSSEINISDCHHNSWGLHNCRHNEDAGVLCYSDDWESSVKVRLVGGYYGYSGRVEVYYMNEWGSVCDNIWDNTDATVVCKMLGHMKGGLAYGESKFRSRTTTTKIWLDNVSCNDWNDNITECKHSKWGHTSCTHANDAGVQCLTSEMMSDVKVRLARGEKPDRGRVEVNIASEWGTVCYDDFNDEDARSLCSMFGHRSQAVRLNWSAIEQSKGNIWNTNLTCQGNHSLHTECDVNVFGLAKCSKNQDLGVWCTNTEDAAEKMSIRLVGGVEHDRGRLEVSFMDTWGTVCGKDFTDGLAGNICGMFGYGYNGFAVKGSVFGKGIGPIWLDKLSCSDNDTSLMYCDHAGWGNVDCLHDDDIGIWCTEYNTDIQVRLNGSIHNDRGRVEVNFMDIWGTICNNGWDDNDASLVCRKLGFMNGGIAVSTATFEQGSGMIWLENLNCSFEDTNITDCQHAGWGNTSCDHSQDAGVICLTEGGIECSPWGTWTKCSVTCGNGTSTRNRKCRREDTKGSVGLFGQDVIDVQNCSKQLPCPIDGEWSNWSDWSSCSASCEKGIRTKQRLCNNPAAQYGGHGCVGNEYEAEECSSGIKCPVNGNWSQWSAWSRCSATCDNGTRTRSRDCNDPQPLYGGNICDGTAHEEENCFTFVPCPVNGEWGNWSSWSECSASCERGYRTRTRQCDEPSPNFGGMPCVGNNYDAEDCVTGVKCPVDGQWSEWEQWSECTTTCDNGTSVRKRLCNNPAPYFGGLNCLGHDNESIICDTSVLCPVDGQWNSWNEWSDCSVTCECGYVHRERNCSNPFPRNGGNSCIGEATQINNCIVNKTCPVQCDEGSYLCQDSITCIRKHMACDNINHCPDGEDEVNCLYLFTSTAESLVTDTDATNTSVSGKPASSTMFVTSTSILMALFSVL